MLSLTQGLQSRQSATPRACEPSHAQHSPPPSLDVSTNYPSVLGDLCAHLKPRASTADRWQPLPALAEFKVRPQSRVFSPAQGKWRQTRSCSLNWSSILRQLASLHSRHPDSGDLSSRDGLRRDWPGRSPAAWMHYTARQAKYTPEASCNECGASASGTCLDRGLLLPLHGVSGSMQSTRLRIDQAVILLLMRQVAELP